VKALLRPLGLGSIQAVMPYVNDFNYLGRTYQLIVQSDEQFKRTIADISRLKLRNAAGEMVPIGTVATFMDIDNSQAQV
jgi:multidrug efflux pump subunit AcrB